MANKNKKNTGSNGNGGGDSRQEKIRKENAWKYKSLTGKLAVYPRIGLVLAALVIVLFFVTWIEIYNTDIPGVEVSANGWAFVAAKLTGNYSSASAIYGDLAVPFYYYAGEYCESLALYTLIALGAALIALAVEAAAAFKKEAYALNYAAAVVNAVTAVMLFICTGAGRAMTGSDILPIYCSGNPACSIHSYAAIPAVAAVMAAAVNVLAAVKYTRARKLVK